MSCCRPSRRKESRSTLLGNGLPAGLARVPALGPASHDSDDHSPLYPSGEACACPAGVLGEFQGFKPVIGLKAFA